MMDEIMNFFMKQTNQITLLAFMAFLVSCEVVDDDMGKHTADREGEYIELNEVARIISALPLENSHLAEVHDAVTSSSDNGYDEEYTMKDLFESPGRGVGESKSPKDGKSGYREYVKPLRELIRSYVCESSQTRSGAVSGAEDFLDALVSSDIQIYWPFSEGWNGETMPIITFDPEDGSDANVGYRLFYEDDGSRRVEEVIVDEEMASKVPVWVVNRNSDAEYTTLELLRREDPGWGEGGGTIIVKPDVSSLGSEVRKSGPDDAPLTSLVLKDFTMNRNYDSWFAGASEFFVLTGSLDDYTASTEAELRLYNPLITSFMISVKRSQVGKTQPFNAVLITDWNPQMTHCAFMITEDDGGTRTDWKCTALVRIASKSYGVEINLPFNTRDDIVWRGHLTNRWHEANSGKTGHFGDIDLTFEVVEH